MSTSHSVPSAAAVAGSLIGTAVGDAIGLPYEGLSRRRAPRLLGPPDRHRLVFGRGMVSDDTEHTCLVAQALIGAGGDHDLFLRRLAWGLRLWMLGLPAGVGFATLRAILRLWLGASPRRSGVFSAGNGPAMRSAILGAAVAEREELLALVRLSTRITHSDPKAEYGAIAVALAARASWMSPRVDAAAYLSELRAVLPPEAGELLDRLGEAAMSAGAGESTAQFAEAIGQARGVSGYVYHCVPVAIHAWLGNPGDFRTAIVATVACGGDTDTTAAIVGGIVGSGAGTAGIPQEWIAGIREWPRSIEWMERLARCLHETLSKGDVARAPRLPLVPVLLRNAFFLVVVLLHGFRRLGPPY
jgi:ADP-ribosylglycohydrolase